MVAILFERLQENGLPIIEKSALALGIFVVCYIFSKKIVARIRARVEANSLVNDTYAQRNSKLIGNVVFIVLMIFTILAIFQILGLEMAIVMGAISMSIGFALQSTIENMVSGLMILTHKKIKIGEFIQFMGPINMMGTVEEITIRYCVIRTFDKRRTIIPNSVIAKTPIKTLKSEPLLKGELIFKIPRSALVSQVRELIIPIINENKFILYPEYTSLFVSGFDNIGITIKAYFFANPAKKSAALVARDLKGKIFDQLKTYGITTDYQHLTITTE